MIIQSCGFVVEKHIDGPYYLIDIDTDDDISVSYDLGNGDYIERVPPNVVATGFSDSLLVAMSVNSQNQKLFYIVNRKRDHPYAKEEEYLKGPITEDSFQLYFKSQLNIKMRAVER